MAKKAKTRMVDIVSQEDTRMLTGLGTGTGATMGAVVGLAFGGLPGMGVGAVLGGGSMYLGGKKVQQLRKKSVKSGYGW